MAVEVAGAAILLWVSWFTLAQMAGAILYVRQLVHTGADGRSSGHLVHSCMLGDNDSKANIFNLINFSFVSTQPSNYIDQFKKWGYDPLSPSTQIDPLKLLLILHEQITNFNDNVHHYMFNSYNKCSSVKISYLWYELKKIEFILCSEVLTIFYYNLLLSSSQWNFLSIVSSQLLLSHINKSI